MNAVVNHLKRQIAEVEAEFAKDKESERLFWKLEVLYEDLADEEQRIKDIRARRGF